MNIVLKFILLVLLGYTCGNVSFAKFFSKKRATNITQSGSGNPGSMNMLRTHGATLGILTLIFDALKAYAPSIIAYYWVKSTHSLELAQIALYSAGLAAVIGHIYPIVNKFKGGKGIASTFGVFIAANPVAALIVFAGCFCFFLVVKIGSLASMVFILSFGTYQTIASLIKGDWIILFLLWAIIILDIYAHRENIKRLFSKTERITSFQEGVKKDLENLKRKKQLKLEKKQQKQALLQTRFKEKIEKTTDKLERKLMKKLNKNARKVKKAEKRIDKKADRLTEKDKILSKKWRLARAIEKEKEKEKSDALISKETTLS